MGTEYDAKISDDDDQHTQANQQKVTVYHDKWLDDDQHIEIGRIYDVDSVMNR